MTSLDTNISAISELAKEITLAMMDKEEEAKQITGDVEAPMQLAGALEEFFQMCGQLDAGHVDLDVDELRDFANYGISLLDRLAYLTRQLELMDLREKMSRLHAGLAVWLVRQDATLDNIEGAADGFGWIVNGLSDQKELAEICRMMDEVIEATSESIAMDENRDNLFRPWRIINLNTGIAATRSLDPELMQDIFEKLGRRLPYDMASFLADGKRQMIGQNIPEEIETVMKQFAERWADKKPH